MYTPCEQIWLQFVNAFIKLFGSGSVLDDKSIRNREGGLYRNEIIAGRPGRTLMRLYADYDPDHVILDDARTLDGCP